MIRSVFEAKQNANCSLSTRKEGEQVEIGHFKTDDPSIGSIGLSDENDHCPVVDDIHLHNNGEDKREN
ncbi:hypothetical protein PILCRDRAFT_830446 [Piloderma croceum F 1598]|uniref:Uncharacterized protein n=1 Tax=Piloderma croceum (strain F 1598) TaxID=765440 RepID=A0A0C3B218_PILCF|nr:hypothetical protein PILCRDRAFT_830446 [Piloderma croceum F 1598]